MEFNHPRMKREFQIVSRMINIYCRGNHKFDKILCHECEALQAYTKLKLTNCRFQEKKPKCSSCPVHCYRKSMQIKIREVMRYAGPKMIYLKPIMTIWYLLAKQKIVEVET